MGEGVDAYKNGKVVGHTEAWQSGRCQRRDVRAEVAG
jgi:hypothetical protein